MPLRHVVDSSLIRGLEVKCQVRRQEDHIITASSDSAPGVFVDALASVRRTVPQNENQLLPV
jgi:hypothetical protein